MENTVSPACQDASAGPADAGPDTNEMSRKIRLFRGLNDRQPLPVKIAAEGLVSSDACPDAEGCCFPAERRLGQGTASSEGIWPAEAEPERQGMGQLRTPQNFA